MGHIKSWWGAVCVVMLVMGLSACGSSSSNSSTTASTAVSTPATSSTGAAPSASSAVAAANAAVAKYTAAQPSVSVPSIGQPVPKGKTVAIVTCPLPVCTSYSNGAVAAAKALGWTVQLYVFQITPESYISVWNTLLQKHPDAIDYESTFPNAIIKAQLAQVQKLKIPTVEIAPSGDLPSPAGPVKAVVVGPNHFELSGELMGDAAVADAGKGPQAVFVWDKALGLLWTPIKDGFTKVVTGAGGSVAVLQVPGADIGKNAPSEIVNFLQSHPNVTYVSSAVDDYMIGVPQALAAAGMSHVKIVGRAPQAGDLSAIKSSSELAAVAEEESAGGYRSINSVIRLMLHLNMSCCTEPVGWHQLIEKSNVTETTGPPATPGSPQDFLKAWGLAG